MMTTTLDRNLSDLDWLDLMPEGWEPPGLRDALVGRRDALARLEACTARQEAARSQLAALVASVEADALDVHLAALDAVATREVVAALPPTPEVGVHFGEVVVERIAGWFREQAVSLGSPPLILSEVRHFEEQNHPGEPRPRMTDRESEVVGLFEQVAAEVFRMRQQAAHHSRALDAERLPDRVRGWAGFRSQYETHRVLVEKTARLVAEVDAERLTSPSLHRCRFLGGRCGPLQPIELCPGEWSVRWALTTGEGVPVRVALDPVGAQ